jgi:hypothetical protein
LPTARALLRSKDVTGAPMIILLAVLCAALFFTVYVFAF